MRGFLIACALLFTVAQGLESDIKRHQSNYFTFSFLGLKIQLFLTLQNNFRYFPWYNLIIWHVRRVAPVRIHPQVYATPLPNVLTREASQVATVRTASGCVALSRQVLVEPPSLRIVVIFKIPVSQRVMHPPRPQIANLKSNL